MRNLLSFLLALALFAGCAQSSSDRAKQDKDPDFEPGVWATDATAGETGPIVETFIHSPPPADVLFVIDASCSMGAARESMLATLDGILATWVERNLEFHAGVLNIDDAPAQGVLLSLAGVRWVERTSPEPAVLLRSLVAAVPSDSTTEEARDGIVMALELTAPGGPNEGFLREGSDLAIVVHTDAEDQSNGLTPDAFVDAILALRPDAELRGFYPIAATEDYFALSPAIGGLAWDVYTTPYGPLLQVMSDALQGENAFVLSTAPIVATIEVRVTEPDGTVFEPVIHIEFTVDEATRTVDLGEYQPMTGASVEITYSPLDGA